jgi:hypothetical protein
MVPLGAVMLAGLKIKELPAATLTYKIKLSAQDL